MLKIEGVHGVLRIGAEHPRALDRARALERLLRKADAVAVVDRRRTHGQALMHRSGETASRDFSIER